MVDRATEQSFQNEIIQQMLVNGWLLGTADGYNRELALYEEDLLGFIRETQGKQWQKYCKLYPQNPEKHLLERLTRQLGKADSKAADRELRTFGTLGVLRHELRDRGVRFKLCQFKPEHDLNPETLSRYQKNRLRLVPELVYSPYATAEHLAATGKQAQKWRIDLVLFVNGLPIATLELKSEFKQAVENAVKQYKRTRLPRDPVTRKPEPLLSFKRGALVHFAVSQYEVYMTTRLDGDETFFLPFNQGTKEGGAGNEIPENPDEYASGYLWNEVLLPDNLLKILHRYVHLQIEEKENWQGKKYKQETMIFPRYHQWDVVNKLLVAAGAEGPGHKYLIQHSAGSGKSNSIAWTAHQLSSLYTAAGEKLFNSVIVVTDRTVLDDQLQETIYQFEHADGVVGRINRKEGEGSKSEKLAQALEVSQPIIIVTIQTFPFVLQAIENNVSLKERRYAIIADEAHSSQTGSTARQLKEVLLAENAGDEVELTAEDILDATIAARRSSESLSYFAFTATPKPKTLELFGRLPYPHLPPSKPDNLPEAFHVYSMRQAIEEGFILDVLKNYTNYKVANKFQTGFDQPKLCAMYVDKKLYGVECVQTLSRLNRNYPGKKESGTFVLDFFNEPQDILDSFQPYYQTAELLEVSDPNLVFDLFDKLCNQGIFIWPEVEQFAVAFFAQNKSNAAISNICKAAVERWQGRYQTAVAAYRQAKEMFARAQKSKDEVLIANTEKSFKEAKKAKDGLEVFKKDLGSFTRFYEFMSQIVDYDNKDLEKLSLYARHLRPLLRERLDDDDDIDLSNVALSHYRLSKQRQRNLVLETEGEYGLTPGSDLGTARPKDRREEFLSRILARLNELFITDNLTDKDLVNYAQTIRDKMRENSTVMDQIRNNSPEQARLGDFPKALDDAVLDSSQAHQNQMLQYLNSQEIQLGFQRVVFDMLQAERTAGLL